MQQLLDDNRGDFWSAIIPLHDGAMASFVILEREQETQPAFFGDYPPMRSSDRPIQCP